MRQLPDRVIKLSFPFLFLAVLVSFYPELFFAQAAPLVSDHWEQHYPWAYFFWKTLRQGGSPFWTSAIHCGFPLAAESQIGVFYLPNLVLYALLPLEWAYSYLMLLHFLIAGLSLYAYVRVMGLSRSAAFTGALVFVFGTAYGGAYYNLTSLKTLAWFPLQLWLFEKYSFSGQKRFWMMLAFLNASVLAAGYMQVAALGLMIFVVYVLLRLFIFKSPEHYLQVHRLKALAGLFFSAVIALFLAAPQILATFQLALLSNREAPEPGYAYSGSMSPFALITVLFPHTQALFRGNSLYNGIFTVFLCFCGLSAFRTRSFIRLWSVLGLFALLLALGRWSPLYVFIVESTGFQSFRTPAKFLVFINLAAAMLAAAGWDALRLSLTEAEKILKKGGLFFGITAGFAGAGIAAAVTLMQMNREAVTKIGNRFVEMYIYQKPGHPHSLEIYQGKLQSQIDNAIALFSISEFWTLWTLLLLGLSFGLIFAMIKFPIKKIFFLRMGLILLLVDLYAFSWKDIRTDFMRYRDLPSYQHLSDMIKKSSSGSIPGRLYGYRAWNESLPMTRSVNMLYGLDDIGAYSPLVMSRYYQTVGLLGNVDDSTLAHSPEPDFVLDRLNFLNFLGVSHVVAARPLEHEAFELLPNVSPQASFFLYRNRQYRTLSPAFTADWEVFPGWAELKDKLMSPGFDPGRTLLIELSEISKLKIELPSEHSLTASARVQKISSKDSASVWEVNNKQGGFLIFPETYFPGWTILVNGRAQTILKAHGMFQGIYLDAGHHRIEKFYSFIKALQEIRK